jgi:hypothetical protein
LRTNQPGYVYRQASHPRNWLKFPSYCRGARERPSSEIGLLPLEIPAGSQTVLENIDLRTDGPSEERVRPRAVRQLDIFGRADLVECAADDTGVLLLVDGGRPARQFMVRLDAGTAITGRAGLSLACVDIPHGSTVHVEGLVRIADRTIVALAVELSGGPPSTGSGPRPEQVRGVVSRAACDRGLVEVTQRSDAETVGRVIALRPSTEFHCRGQSTCDCGAIVVGDPIVVDGTISPAAPGLVLADVVDVGALPEPVTLTGVVTSLACEGGALAVRERAGALPTRVVLTPETDVRCPGQRPCECAGCGYATAFRSMGTARWAVVWSARIASPYWLDREAQRGAGRQTRFLASDAQI